MASRVGIEAGPGPHAGPSSAPALRLAPSLAGLRLLLLRRQLGEERGASSAKHSSKGSLGALRPVVNLLAPWTTAAASAGLRTQALWDLRLPWVSQRAELKPSPGWHESLMLRGQETGLQVCGCHCCVSASVRLQNRETRCPRLASHPAWRRPGEGCGLKLSFSWHWSCLRFCSGCPLSFVPADLCHLDTWCLSAQRAQALSRMRKPGLLSWPEKE